MMNVAPLYIYFSVLMTPTMTKCQYICTVLAYTPLWHGDCPTRSKQKIIK